MAAPQVQPSYATNPRPASFTRSSIPPAPQVWHTGLCDCDGDWGLAFETVCCAPGQIGRIYSGALRDETNKMYVPACGTALAIHCFLNPVAGCCWPFYLRRALRKKHNLEGSCPTDALLSLLCMSCSLCQMHRELTQRGVTPGTSCCPAKKWAPAGSEAGGKW